jgi:hypothetical protein
MCLSNEAVDELHAITSAIKDEQSRRDTWLGDFNGAEPTQTIPLNLTRAEAERIFADRIAAHEARLKELGWARTIRVEPDRRMPSMPPTEAEAA